MDGLDDVVTSPENGGPNSLWLVNHDTHPTIAKRGIVLISICSPVPTALTFVDYYVFDQDDALQAAKAAVANGEPTLSVCDGEHLTGFSFVDMTPGALGGLPVPGYESMSKLQTVRLSDFPKHFAIVANTDDMVSAVRFFVPLSNVVVASSPFQHTVDWLRSEQAGSVVKIRADAYTSHIDEVLLGSCEIELEIEEEEEAASLSGSNKNKNSNNNGQEVSCGPSVTGFRLVDRNGEPLTGPEYDHLRNGQVIPSSSLPHGTDIAVHHKENVGAVKYETEKWGDVYETNHPFRINSNSFHLPGTYIIRVHGYSDVDFATLLNSCEIQFQII